MRNFIADSMPDLIGNLKEHIKTFLRKEVELAKKEISEKISTYARNSVKLVVGGFVAYAGLIVFLAGIGLVIGFAFKRLGLDATLAVFIGLAIVGFFASAIGGIMLLQGIKTFSATSPVPEKAIDTMKQITDGTGVQIAKPPETEDPRSSDALYESASRTAERVQEAKEELAFQLSPRELKERAVRHIKEHPLMWSAAALGGAATVATGSVLLGRKLSDPHGRRWAPLAPLAKMAGLAAIAIKRRRR
ncbi:MAG: phage holin family protein [Limisphaerales bacterium]